MPLHHHPNYSNLDRRWDDHCGGGWMETTTKRSTTTAININHDTSTTADDVAVVV